jgi:drug/metabolite transporter (DMT)-like permease
MNESSKFRRFVAVVSAVLVLGAILVVLMGAVQKDNWASLLSIVILVTMALVALVVARKSLRERKSGFPMDDERSKAIKMRAGYLAFFVSIYVMLAMGFAIAILEDNQVSSLPTSEWFMFFVAIMGSIYLIMHAYFSRAGVPG